MKQFEQERRVVIVDDSRTIQAFLENAFGTHKDFRVVGFASDAKSAADVVRRLMPDIVTIDLNMPYLDGEALLAMIKDCESVCKIIVSDIAVENRLLSARLIQAGATVCLGKSDLVRNPDLFFQAVTRAADTVRKNRYCSASHGRSKSVLKYPIPLDEDARIARGHSKSLFNAKREPHFDALTHHAAKLTAFPIGLLTFIDHDTQWVKSAYGLSLESTSREVAFCNYTITQGGAFVVADAASDDRFAENPLVKDAPKIRTYTGLPVKDGDDLVIGALCVIDSCARTVSKHALDQLAALADIASSIIALRSPGNS